MGIVEEEVFDSRDQRFEIGAVFVALGLGSRSSLPAEVKQCTAIRCRQIVGRPLKLLASRLSAEEHVDVECEVPHC